MNDKDIKDCVFWLFLTTMSAALLTMVWGSWRVGMTIGIVAVAAMIAWLAKE